MKLKRLPQVLLGIAACAFAWSAYVWATLPDVRPLAMTNPTSTAFMELRAREARAHGQAPQRNHRWVGYGRISADLKRAVLTAEDAAFWEHDGVDYAELQKSIERDWTRPGSIRGASTITQQLAKNLYLSPSRSPIRKVRELIITRRLEAELSKARILELYLNVIEWGEGIYGVEAASRVYFGKPASALGPSESALLAGAIINARLLNPAKPNKRLIRRQQLILRRMGGVAPPVPDTTTSAPEERDEVQPEHAEPAIEPPVAPLEPLPDAVAPSTEIR